MNAIGVGTSVTLTRNSQWLKWNLVREFSLGWWYSPVGRGELLSYQGAETRRNVKRKLVRNFSLIVW